MRSRPSNRPGSDLVLACSRSIFGFARIDADPGGRDRHAGCMQARR
ncbi:hypothetical protein [Rhodoblastus sp.]|nr:hypothetical protein [Rhodoblastus sp.]